MGFGKVAFQEGIYQGEVENGMANGYGLIKFFNGDIYMGEMKNNCMTGIGTKSTASYITLGKFISGKRCGHCCTVQKLKISTGIRGFNHLFIPEYYIGNYSNDLKSGKGTYLYKHGDAYDGNFQNDLPNGKGAYSHNSSYPDRDGYFAEGNFVNGKLVGSYTQYGWTKFAQGDIFYGTASKHREHFYYGYGEWVDDKFGKERRIGYHNDVYGTWSFNGAKIFYKYNLGAEYSMQVGDFGKTIAEKGDYSKIHRNLDMYIGHYSYGKKDGEGVYASVDDKGNIKELYIGNFRDGSKCLDNIIIYADGCIKKQRLGLFISIKMDGKVHEERERPHPSTRPYKNVKDFIKNRKPNIWVDTILQDELPVYEGVLNGGVQPSQSVQPSQNVQVANNVQTSPFPQTANGNQNTVLNNQASASAQGSGTASATAPVKPVPPPPPPPPPKKEFEIDGETLVEYNGKDDYAVVPEEVTKIGENAFANAKKFLKRVAFYDTLTEIGENAFADCFALEQVELSASLTKIGNGAFKNCKKLKHIKRVPDGLKNIGENAFAGCESLSRFTLPYGCDYSESSFPQSCRVYKQREPDPPSEFDVEFKTLVRYTGKDENVVVPSGASFMWPEAFRDVKDTLKSIVFSEGLVSIYNYTFQDFEKLEKVVLPESLKDIQRNAFAGCKNLSEINFPDNITKIGDNAFSGCEKLKKVRLVDTCQYSNEDAEKLSFPKGCKVELYNLKALEEEKFVKENFDIDGGVLKKYIGSSAKVVVPSVVKQILPDAFDDAKEFLEQITISEGVTKIESNTFSLFAKLKKVTLPSTVKEIGDEAFCKCFELKEVNFPSGIEKIGKDAFFCCRKLSKISLPENCSFFDDGSSDSFHRGCIIISDKQPFKIVNGKLLEYRGTKTEIVIPKGVKKIERDAFDRVRESVTEIIILSNSLKQIDIAVFKDCKNLAKVQLPEKLKKIDNAAFRNCVSLENIEFPESLEVIGCNAFVGCEKLKSVTLPKGCDYKLKSDLNSSFPQDCEVIIKQEAVEIIKENNEETKPVVFDIKNGVLVNYLGKDEVVVVPEEVTQIGSNAFYFAKDFVKEVVVPDGVTEIGFSAFKDSEKLEKVKLPEELKVIEMRAFENCKNLKQINLPKGLEKIEKSAFDGCDNLTLPKICEIVEPELDDELFLISDDEDSF